MTGTHCNVMVVIEKLYSLSTMNVNFSVAVFFNLKEQLFRMFWHDSSINDKFFDKNDLFTLRCKY